MTLVSVCVHFLKLLDTQTHRHRHGHRAWQYDIFSQNRKSLISLSVVSGSPGVCELLSICHLSGWINFLIKVLWGTVNDHSLCNLNHFFFLTMGSLNFSTGCIEVKAKNIVRCIYSHERIQYIYGQKTKSIKLQDILHFKDRVHLQTSCPASATWNIQNSI